MTREVLIMCAAGCGAIAMLLLWRPPHAPGSVRSEVRPSWIDRTLSVFARSPEPPVAELLSALAAELSAGQPTTLALPAAAAGLVPNPCPQALAACRTGGDVPEALRRDSLVPGAQALRGLAACWEVAQRSGAGLSVAVTRLADGLRAGALAEAQLSGEVAAVRTSARLLAGLPLFGLAIGHWIGAQPVSWLTGSWLGRVVLLAGLTLQVAGMVWLHQMVARTRAGL